MDVMSKLRYAFRISQLLQLHALLFGLALIAWNRLWAFEHLIKAWTDTKPYVQNQINWAEPGLPGHKHP